MENPNSLVLENKRAKICFYQDFDPKNLEEIFYPEVLDNLELILEPKLSLLESYLQHLEKQNKSVSVQSFFCFDKDKKGALAGFTQLKYIDLYNKKLEMGGTWFGKEFQGTGLNHAVKHLLLTYCFEHLKMNRVQFSIDDQNQASIKSMDRIGAIYEGKFRNNWVDNTGISRDDVYYSIISNDWKQVKEKYFSEFL
ncbi:MAG: N-acetyltransferase [Flavobacteriaceae bacterium]|nr:MAG: N-acetyltransferase [Flavobacteriaceae bacterium]